jgi:hypothetical protein
MVLIYQPPNAHVRILVILLRNAMAAAAVKKIYTVVLQDVARSALMMGYVYRPWICRGVQKVRVTIFSYPTLLTPKQVVMCITSL